jgi:hypothetical protein
MTRFSTGLLTTFLIAFFLSGCKAATYPEAEIISSIQEICRKEYKIEGVEVELVGKTIGVFLPLKKLFTTDVKHLVMTGKVEDLESLFEPEPEAMDQLEDVLFTISRVMLSTDKEIDFYVLKAADVKGTGLQLVLTGYIPDVRRVRLWDIPRSEYRKRVFHELKLNRTILWEEPIRGFFKDIKSLNRDELEEEYFLYKPTPETVSPFFYDFLKLREHKEHHVIDLLELKSYPYANLQALVYVKFAETFSLKPGIPKYRIPYESGFEHEYIFIVEPGETEFKIAHVIPFQYLDEQGQLQRSKFPRELELYQDLESWSERFEVVEIFLGEFLARQLNRRVQGLLMSDERVRLTVKSARLNFVFLGGEPDKLDLSETPHFILYFNLLTKPMKSMPTSLFRATQDDDVQYVLDLMLKELNSVVRGYSFSDFGYVELMWDGGPPSETIKISPESLELFRRGKLDIKELLGVQSTSPIQ